MTVKYDSIYGAEVVDNKDPMKLGRVKVKVGILGDEFPTEWAWPCSLMSGVSSGWFSPPPQKAKVFVQFLEGDPEHPVYVGGLWSAPSGVNEVPEEFQTEDVTNRGFKSPGGHLLEFDDGSTTPGVRIKSVGGCSMIFDDTSGEEKVFLLHPSGAQIQLNSKGSVQAINANGAFIALDAENKVATVVSEQGSIVALDDKVTMMESTGKTALTLSGDTLQINSGSDLLLTAPSVTLKSGNVNLGDGASLGVALAKPLADLFDKHLHATAMGPSGPPLPPNTAALTNLAPPTSFESLFIKSKGNS